MIKTFIGYVDTPFDSDDAYPYETKIGGAPIWCSQPPAQYKDLKCTSCSKENLAFLLQAYCPLDSVPDYERNYYIFVCPKCSNGANGWKVIKCLDPLKEYDDDQDDDEEDNENDDEQEEEVTTKKEQGDWGVDDDDWGADDDNENETSTTTTTSLQQQEKKQTIAEMIKSRDQQLQLDQNKPKKKQPQVSLRESFNSEQEIISGVVIENDKSNQYESYYLFIEEEKLKKQQHQQQEDQSHHLKKYQSHDVEEAEAWSGETYEYVQDRVFSKFLKKIGSNPDQCLRYSFGGEALCMSNQGVEQVRNAPKCKQCSRTKTFEFQILSTMITQIEPRNNQPNELDFGNAFIYSCPNNCYDKSKDIFNDVAYIEDSIIIERAV
ncbi:hypothetical protein DFA_11741 [Cavenderia fasciculata]|uniref:Programmed cell death protein 2 C-terminal domain-containing protein n=1 Tax=Cavenderia fasciculata TaxID=261658 RepID=F4QE33_CACFS|nr:uncharacterized protein DFA_11741 [Cavenderia fasciculata]EGG13980.1 hypothetical protein DFA_11741 [Cavenderia fasciculata]|eukprot:XP_004350688.1 hypothetical protein DFA_11741 [Cavenderia fasciculata]